jgi:hypothetical protein
MVVLTTKMRDAITSIARPLPPPERKAFMSELMEELVNRRDSELGDGSLGRLLRSLQLPSSPAAKRRGDVPAGAGGAVALFLETRQRREQRVGA